MPKVKLVISSSESSFRTTLPPLLTSLVASGVSPKDVAVVVVNAKDGDEFDMIEMPMPNGADDIRVDASFVSSTNALTWAVSDHTVLEGYDWLFLLHDATTVMPHFAQRLPEVLDEALRRDQYTSAVKLCRTHSRSMGYYKVDAVWAVRDAICAPVDPAEPAEDLGFRLIERAGGRVDALRPHEGCDAHDVVMRQGREWRRETHLHPGIYTYHNDLKSWAP